MIESSVSMKGVRRYIADLHIHSHYSRATSKNSNLTGLFAWAQIKGIHLLGTGDFTHPGWFAHLEKNLQEAEAGFFSLKPDVVPDYSSFSGNHVSPMSIKPRFVLTTEISSIYKRGGKLRKVHNLIVVPDFASAENLNRSLAKIGNLKSDGRPILGLDSRDLLEIVLEKTKSGFLVPAHIWTPWFSLFGSKSGFDHIEECYGDLTEHIFALETGLSSDPDMNRLIPALDQYTLISNSDCHSPAKLGREANIFQTEFSFAAMRRAMEKPCDDQGNQRFLATIEFFPEEGKYHLDGHRKCDICWRPEDTAAHDGLCPECGRQVTVGVLNRVMEFSKRKSPLHPLHAPLVHSITPLPELLAEILQVGPASKKVMRAYGSLVSRFGSEFGILLATDLCELDRVLPMLGEAVRRLRQGKVIRESGFDGKFGRTRMFTDAERKSFGPQELIP